MSGTLRFAEESTFFLFSVDKNPSYMDLQKSTLHGFAYLLSLLTKVKIKYFVLKSFTAFPVQLSPIWRKKVFSVCKTLPIAVITWRADIAVQMQTTLDYSPWNPSLLFPAKCSRLGFQLSSLLTAGRNTNNFADPRDVFHFCCPPSHQKLHGDKL